MVQVNVLNKVIQPVEKKEPPRMYFNKARPVRINDCEKAIRKATLSVATAPDLRAVYLFRYYPDGVEWTLFEKEVTRKETKGLLYTVMCKMKETMNFVKIPVQPAGKWFIKEKKPILAELENMEEDEHFFIIVLTKDEIQTYGTAYEESALCHAFLQAKPLRFDTVIRNMTKGKARYLLESSLS